LALIFMHMIWAVCLYRDIKIRHQIQGKHWSSKPFRWKWHGRPWCKLTHSQVLQKTTIAVCIVNRVNLF